MPTLKSKNTTGAALANNFVGTKRTPKEISDTDKISAGVSELSDPEKYQVAVTQARTELGDTASDKDLRNRIDDIYVNQFDGKEKPSDLRGESVASQAIRWLDEGMDTVFNGAGGGVDWLFDNTIGAGVEALGGGTAAKDLFSGEDVGAILDMGADIGLAFIPGAGIPLVVAKNAIQNSENIYEAATGRDAVTRESIDAGQRGAKVGATALNVGLSALPGIGKVLGKTASAAAPAARATIGDVAASLAKRGVTRAAGAAAIPASMVANISAGTGQDLGSSAATAIDAVTENPLSLLAMLAAPKVAGKVTRKLPTPTGKNVMSGEKTLTRSGQKAVESSKNIVDPAAQEAAFAKSLQIGRTPFSRPAVRNTYNSAGMINPNSGNAAWRGFKGAAGLGRVYDSPRAAMRADLFGNYAENQAEAIDNAMNRRSAQEAINILSGGDQ